MPNILRRRFSARAQALRYDDRTLAEHFFCGAMRHPAISKMIEERFHRTRRVHDIRRRSKYEQVGLQNRLFDNTDILSVFTSMFALRKAVRAADAKIRAIFGQIELGYIRIARKRRQKFFFERVCDAALFGTVYHDYFHDDHSPKISRSMRVWYAFLSSAFFKSTP